MQKQEELKKSFQNFNEVEDNDIRTWNRCAMAFNIGAKSVAQMKEYLKQFSQNDMLGVRGMLDRVTKDGYENTRRSIMRANSQKPHEEAYA